MEFGIKTLKEVSKSMQENLQKGLRDQGHYLTGALERSLNIAPLVDVGDDQLTVDVDANEYIDTLDQGVPPEHIPVTAAYILEMAAYATLRFGYTGRKALQVGAAIAAAHKREGNPTRNSYQFSSTGDRLNVIEESYDGATYDLLFENGMDAEMDALIDATFAETEL